MRREKHEQKEEREGVKDSTLITLHGAIFAGAAEA
jgi:hypothetical protein